MFPGEKSRECPLPVDETCPTDGSKSIRQPKEAKKEVQRLNREAELQKRKMLERSARQQARALLLKRQQVMRNLFDGLEWCPLNSMPTKMGTQICAPLLQRQGIWSCQMLSNCLLNAIRNVSGDQHRGG